MKKTPKKAIEKNKKVARTAAKEPAKKIVKKVAK